MAGVWAAWFTTVLDALPNSSVYPSGLARTTASAAIEPLAPTRLSTITGCLSESCSHCATSRQSRSALLPAPLPVTSVMGREG